ncbi:MAG: UPF0104 family protein [Methanobacteriaceae archaeon]
MSNTYDTIRKHKWKIILSFAASFFIIFIISFIIGINDIINVLKRTNLEFLLLNFILEAVIILIWALRWSLILNVVDKAPKFKTTLIMLMASLFGNNVTPGAAGGEPLRAYLLRELEGTPFEIGFASSTADRVFEFFPFVIISLFAAIFILTWNISIITRLVVSVLIFITMIFFVILIYAGLNKDIAQRMIIRIARSIFPFIIKFTKKPLEFIDIREKLIFYINRFSTGFMQALEDKKVFLMGFFISFGMWGVDVLRIYVCFVALGSYPPIIPLVIIYTVAILISLLPILPGSWGIREATLVALFAVVGVPADVVLAASIIDRLASYFTVTFIGAVAALYYGKLIKTNKSVTV